MRKLVWHASFRRAVKRRTKNNPDLRQRILDAVEKLTQDPYDPILRTHKLRGQLEGLWACWVEYDCRIIFTIETLPERQGEEAILLIDVGTHEEVY